jgi:FAD/FMN-containing dehydrogenase
MSLKDELAALLEGEVEDSATEIERCSRDASLFSISPQVVVFPQNSNDIQKLVSFVAAHPEHNSSLTARAAGTDMTGGPLNESIIVDTTRHLNHLKNIDHHEATTEPGVFYRDFEAATRQHNLLLPSYPASRELCTVGGMVANNSGGELTLTYGKTDTYVRELKAVLRDGKEYTFRPLSKQELEEKMIHAPAFERDIYREMFKLISNNAEILKKAKPKVSKNSAGYALWDVWDREKQLFDLTKLFVGSQGTLGIITEITFRLITPRPHTEMLVIFLKDLDDITGIIKTVLTYHPETFESFDNHTLKLALRFLPSLLKRMGTRNVFSLLWQFLPELFMIATGGIPRLVLLAQFTGYNPEEVRQHTEAAQLALRRYGVKTRRARNELEIKKYLVIRRESFNLLRHHVHDKRTAPFIDDFIVNPEYLPEFFPKLEEIMSHYDITYTIAGHIGDGNFHIIPLMNLAQPDTVKIIEELSEKVYNLVLEYKGSLTAEHNDGLIRSHYLPKMYGEEVYNLFVQTKNIFDPNNIFNPRKKVGADWEYAKKHLIRS